jgi:uncharacterized membrane protein YedE/YeeE
MAVRMMDIPRAAPCEEGRLGAAPPAWLVWGTVIGLVQIFAMLTQGPLGVSTAYPQLVGWAVDKVIPGFAQGQLYLREIKAVIGWEVMLVVGLFAGAFLSHLLSRLTRGHDMAEAPTEAVGEVCVVGFEGSRARRYGRAFVGGFLFIFGARLAGGCTTGHILSGTSQLAVSALVFGAAVIFGGWQVAALFFREPTPAVRAEQV